MAIRPKLDGFTEPKNKENNSGVLVIEPLLKVTQLEKTFGGPYKLGPLDIALSPGETVAFLGKNGAGKTTLFQILTGNMDASSGEVRLAGRLLKPETPEVKRSLGYLPQNHYLPRWVTGREILAYAASLYHLPDAAERIASAERYWDCASYNTKPLAACSHGMQKRIALALATLHDPDCLILDEPFSGLDLYHIRALTNEISRRAAAGKTTLLSTHIAPYTARLCQKAFVIDGGRVSELLAFRDYDYLARIELIEQTFFSEEKPSC